MFQPYLRNQINFAGGTGEETREVLTECSWNTIITVCMSKYMLIHLCDGKRTIHNT